MIEKPISFTAEMVKAILEGRKTVTRRIIKNMPEKWHRRYTAFENNPNGAEEFIIYGDCGTKTIYSHYNVGDLLWIKEAWWDIGHMENGKWQSLTQSHTVKPRYVADCPDPFVEGIGGIEPTKIHWKQTNPLRGTWRKRSPMFMPKWAARKWLEVVNVRIEQLWDITEEDAIREGISGYSAHGGGTHFNPVMIYPAFPEKGGGFSTAKEAYECLWDSINSNRGYPWDGNWWVFRIEFKEYPK